MRLPFVSGNTAASVGRGRASSVTDDGFRPGSINTVHAMADAAGPILRVLANPISGELCIALVQLLQVSLLLSFLHLGAINACILGAFELFRRIAWTVRESWQWAAVVVADLVVASGRRFLAVVRTMRKRGGLNFNAGAFSRRVGRYA